jgi:hypothetical protein
MLIGCSRKNTDISSPDRKGDLVVNIVVLDEYGLLTEQIPLSVAVYEDSSHQAVVATKSLFTMHSEQKTVEFRAINARSSIYYLEIRLDYDGSQAASCQDFPVYIEEGIVRQLEVNLEYGFLGLECAQG